MKVITLRLNEKDVIRIQRLQRELAFKTISQTLRESIIFSLHYLELKRQLKDALSTEQVIDQKKLKEIKYTFNL